MNENQNEVQGLEDQASQTGAEAAETKPAAKTPPYENMHFFKTTYQRADGEKEVAWHNSKAAAEAYMKELQTAQGAETLDAESIEEVLIPVGKKKLIVWLNENVKS